MNIDSMIALTEGIATKADKMRVLERNGYARADIARFLGVRYQQVRNTLEGDKRTGYNPEIVPESDTIGPASGFNAARLRGL
jgi:predicted transcriptional regulator